MSPICRCPAYFRLKSRAQMEEKKTFKNVMEMSEQKLKKMIRHHIKGITQKGARSVLTVVKCENGEDILNKEQFLKKVSHVFDNELDVIDPFCKYCYKRFHNRKNMLAHVAGIHEGKAKKFVCENCPSTFMSAKSLEYHKNTFHSVRNEKVKCETCGKIFSHHISLLRHEKIHEQIKPTIECNICKKTFGRKDSLTKHLKSVHDLNRDMNTKRMIGGLKENEGIYKCKMCQTKFTGNNAEDELETHISRHCQKFECAKCEQVFSVKESLKRHMKAHDSDQVNFNCAKCKYATKYKFNLKKHIKRQHPE